MNDTAKLFVMNGKDDSIDNELLRRMQAGDEQAFVSLYRRRQPGIYRFALQMSGSQAVADDVTQEVFMVLIRGGEGFDPAKGSMSAFLYGVARNQTLRRLRRESFFVPLEPEGSDGVEALASVPRPLEEVSRNETIEAVRRAVLGLPERYREVVILCDLEEMSYAETAEVLGCAIGTVRSRLHRARVLLTDRLRGTQMEAMAADMKTARCFA